VVETKAKGTETEYWVYTKDVPDYLKDAGINFIGFKKRSDAKSFAKEKAKKFGEKIKVQVVECPPNPEKKSDHWKECEKKDEFKVG